MDNFTKTEREKAKSRDFASLGIPVGATLVFKKDPAIAVKTLDGKNKVEYLGKPYSISTLAKQLVGSPVSGYLYFKFEGRILKNLVKTAGVSTVQSTDAPQGSKIPANLGNSAAADDFAADIDPLAGEIAANIEESAAAGAGIGA
jgi:hypothetical protein